MTREEALQAIKAKMDYYESDKRLRCAIETLIPELAESEDERTREEIISALRFANFKGVYDKHIAYLKKQKDAIEAVERIDKFIDEHLANAHDMEDSNPEKKYYRGWDDAIAEMAGILLDVYSGEKQKEQKPILEVFGFKVGDAVRLKDGDGRKHIIKSFEEIEGVHGPNFYHVEFEDDSARVGIYPDKEYPNGYYTQMEKFEKEQKPVEWKPTEEEILSKLPDYTPANLSPYIEQKPAWSKDDDEMLMGCINSLQEDLENILDSDTHPELTKIIKQCYVERIDWLKELPQRLDLQPKQE